MHGDACVGETCVFRLNEEWLKIARGKGESCVKVDLNGDGVVSGADLTILLADWGPCSE